MFGVVACPGIADPHHQGTHGSRETQALWLCLIRDYFEFVIGGMPEEKELIKEGAIRKGREKGRGVRKDYFRFHMDFSKAQGLEVLNCTLLFGGRGKGLFEVNEFCFFTIFDGLT